MFIPVILDSLTQLKQDSAHKLVLPATRQAVSAGSVIMIIKYLFILSALCLFALSCGIESGYEDYNINSIPQLNRTNHPHGYGRRNCFYCHVNRNIHQVDRINSHQITNARRMTKTLGISACYQCHGQNGVVQ